jgi:GTPase SAR1 family protein
MKQEIYFFLIGTAGSGKSTLAQNYKHWCHQQGLESIIINLDPGVEKIPYTPDVDIRDWIKLSEVMESHELGPNGAQIACADMIALNLTEIKESIGQFKSDYIIVDTPGQLELFVFREAGKYTINNLNPAKTMVGYLIDPALAHTPSGFVTQLLLSITTQFRLSTPQINILSKADLLKKADIELIQSWSENSEELYSAVIMEKASMFQQINEGILHIIQEFGGFTEIHPYSKKNFEGIEDIYTMIQQEFEAGEDLLKD